jgi:4-alpha-glucanotransferase
MPEKSSSKSLAANSPLGELAALYEIHPSYTDNFGRRQVASAAAIQATLLALGAPAVSTPEAIKARVAEINSQSVEPIQLAWDGRLKAVQVRLPRKSRLLDEDSRWEVSITQESGARFTQYFKGEDIQTVSGDDYLSLRLPVEANLDWGYHQLGVEAACGRQTLECSSTVISAPVQCYLPPSEFGQTWGAFLPLYSLRSRGHWGTGDFASLARLHRWVKKNGGSWTGTLPLLSSFLQEPFEPSPYMPVSRMFWNELYISPDLEPEFQTSKQARRLIGSPGWRQERAKLARAELVQYRDAMRLKRWVLELMAAELERLRGPRLEQLLRYAAAHPHLADYARFRAVQEKRQQPWGSWPQRLREGKLLPADAVPANEFYHLYVQWIAEQQLKRIKKADDHGGLYLDFPLGVHPDGYDVWRHKHLFALQAAAGAPPDDLFPGGQNWGFHPLHPQAIRQDGYRYFRETLSHQMRHAKLLRVDHVMGLNRLYWIPQGIATRDGVYVKYRAEELYAVLSLESHRARCGVVGENLGTVPPEVTQAIQRHKTLGMFVMQFSVPTGEGQSIAPASEGNVASLNTHDSPTFAGFLAGRDIETFARLQVLTERGAEEKRKERKAILAKLVSEFGVQPIGGAENLEDLLIRCLKWLSESSADVVILNLEDLWGETSPQNIPGTGPGTAHPDIPNWRRRARYSLEEIVRDKKISRLLRVTLNNRLNPNGLAE